MHLHHHNNIQSCIYDYNSDFAATFEYEYKFNGWLQVHTSLIYCFQNSSSATPVNPRAERRAEIV